MLKKLNIKNIKKLKLKRKKGFVLADLFIAFTVAVIIASAISGSMYISSKYTHNQIENLEAYEIGTTLLDTIKASKSIDTPGVLVDKDYKDMLTSVQQQTEYNNDKDIYNKYQRNYHVYALLEKDPFNEHFGIITIVITWENQYGVMRKQEFKGFKVVDM